MVGIVHSKELMADLADMAVIGIGIAKKGVSIGSLFALAELIKKAREVIVEAPQALPELADLDSMEAGQLASQAYVVVKMIVDAVKA